jgi:radical SAM protein with 4Fe4S-binding SPASM domain
MKAVLKPRINLENRTPLQDVIPLATPMIVFVDPASACNFQCTFCPTGDRQLISDTGRFQGVLKLDVFRKVIDDLAGFDQPIKVLRMYKDGEPFLNKHLAEMVAYAKASGRVPYIDTTTNGSLLEPARVQPVIDAGLDRINISVDGMNKQQYMDFTKFNMDFEGFVANVRWLYEHRGGCEVVVKIPGDLLTEAQKQQFLDTFGDIADRVFIENFAPCWPQFDVEERTGVKIVKGIYDQPIGETDTCPYIFYAMSVNADGLVSSCFLDWGRKLIVGDVRRQSLREIWNSDAFNALRMQHLEGRRRENPVCGSCGQLTHCLPDNIDQHRETLRLRMADHLAAQGRRVPVLLPMATATSGAGGASDRST